MLNRPPQEIVVRPSPRNSLQWLRPNIKRLGNNITIKFLPLKILMIQIIMICPFIKSQGQLPSQICAVINSTSTYRDGDKVRILNEEEIIRNLKALQWESVDSNIGKVGIDEVEDGFKELAQELNKKEVLSESVQQTLANILETV